MNLIVGFGTTETQFEEVEISAFKNHVRARYSEMKPGYITDEFAEDIGKWLGLRGEESRLEAERHNDAEEPPDRYSHFYPHITKSASCIVAIFKFSHINRRHAMSPDGWALLQTEQAVPLFSNDLD